MAVTGAEPREPGAGALTLPVLAVLDPQCLCARDAAAAASAACTSRIAAAFHPGSGGPCRVGVAMCCHAARGTWLMVLRRPTTADEAAAKAISAASLLLAAWDIVFVGCWLLAGAERAGPAVAGTPRFVLGRPTVKYLVRNVVVPLPSTVSLVVPLPPAPAPCCLRFT